MEAGGAQSQRVDLRHLRTACGAYREGTDRLLSGGDRRHRLPLRKRSRTGPNTPLPRASEGETVTRGVYDHVAFFGPQRTHRPYLNNFCVLSFPCGENGFPHPRTQLVLQTPEASRGHRRPVATEPEHARAPRIKTPSLILGRPALSTCRI